MTALPDCQTGSAGYKLPSEALDLAARESLLLEQVHSPFLREIFQRALLGERLSKEEGLELLTSLERDAVLNLADLIRKKRVGETVYFASTLYIHPTNLCELSCPMCSFYAKPGWAKAWMLTPDQVEEQVRAAYHKELTEIHIVGGLWRDCNLEYYQEMFTKIKAIDSKLHIKALTPVEYDFLGQLHGISVEEVFERMMQWGLGSLPGGGAEILVEKIRKQLAPQKITSERYLEIHEIAHQLGLPSNITMLFGSVEDEEHIIDHLLQVRKVQDRTHGFQTFVPLKYHVENNALGKRTARLKPKDIHKVFAVSRILLDNIPSIKVLWNYLGVDAALEILSCGANDFSSTNLEEKIIVMAGGIKSQMTSDDLQGLISATGRTPRKIHSGFRLSGKEL
ncbi:MAG: radical protein [Chlamydiales bacterium]|jgi:CofH subfamily radical SAM domain protein|nr:radical protein [Chlamydiales bacterium]